ncbi:MAG: DUF2784 domain-containing protein [Gammaproteobacteria bacterium]|nr:DUF2784 domain-containing protein [Gammaproteobacteria bacterium]
MKSGPIYLLAAKATLVTHALFVVFIIFGLILVFAGKFQSWQWVRNPWFRAVHLLAIGVVVVQSWFGIICPLTIWEMELRKKAADSIYEGSFVSHWLNELLYYQAPPWLFAICYTAFGGLVVFSWFFVRPRPFMAASRNEAGEGPG